MTPYGKYRGGTRYRFAGISPRQPLSIGGCADVIRSPYLYCRRKIEMSPGAQSRDDTPVGDGNEERDLLGSNPPRNSRLETHSDGPGADRNWSAPATRRLPGHHLLKASG